MLGDKSSEVTSNLKPHLDAPEIEPGVVAKETLTLPDGTHEIKVLKSGRIIRCSDCDDIENTFKDELTKFPHLRRRLDEIRLESQVGEKAKAAKKLAKQIGEYRTKRQGILESRSDFESEVPYVSRPKEILDPTSVKIYRGGPDFKLSSTLSIMSHSRACQSDAHRGIEEFVRSVLRHPMSQNSWSATALGEPLPAHQKT
jgi:hypothetical protein